MAQAPQIVDCRGLLGRQVHRKPAWLESGESCGHGELLGTQKPHGLSGVPGESGGEQQLRLQMHLGEAQKGPIDLGFTLEEVRKGIKKRQLS